MFDGNLKKILIRFFNTYKFSNHDITKFILLFLKGVLEIVKRNFIAWKKYFYSYLNMEDITDEDYAHAKIKEISK